MFAKPVAELTDGKFQIQVFAAGEIVPGLQALDALRTARSRCATPCPTTMSARTRPSRSPRVPFGLNARQQNAWLYQGGGNELFNEFYKKYNIYRLAAAATPARRWAAGSARRSRRRRSQGPEDAHRRLRRPGARRSSASCRSRSPAATSIRRWRRARSTPPSGSARTTTRSSASTRSRRTTTTPAGGKAARRCTSSSTSRSGTSCRRATRRDPQRGRTYANTWMQATLRRAQSRRRSSAWSRAARSCGRSRRGPGSLPQGRQRALCRDLGQESPSSRRCIDNMIAFRNDQYLWWQVAEYTYDGFMIRSRPRG